MAAETEVIDRSVFSGSPSRWQRSLGDRRRSLLRNWTKPLVSLAVLVTGISGEPTGIKITALA